MQKLPGLNGLRAIAASVVLIGHVYQIADYFGYKRPAFYLSLFEGGYDMVNLFFVISGFIITYLLLSEKKITNTISLSRFYYKRILRIWPLYFLIILIVFILGNYTTLYDIFEKLTTGSLLILLFFIVAINKAFLYHPIEGLPHYWSLSVEEQFYIFWPLAVKKLNIYKFSVWLIIVWVFVRNLFALMSSQVPDNNIYAGLNLILYETKFPSMAIGAIGAFAVINKKHWFDIFQGIYFQVLIWLLFVLSFSIPSYIPYINFEIKAFLYLLIILSVSINPKPLIQLETKFFDLTGRISYGLYMFHWPVIALIILGLKKAGLIGYFLQFHFAPLVIFSYLLTFIISYFSYVFIESYFLRKKPVGYFSGS